MNYKRIIIIVLMVVILKPQILEVQAGEVDDAYEVYKAQETGEIYYIQKSERFNEALARNIDKPVVAVALGGGGARALVNVGILKALEEEGIPIDLVVGSSMGAIVAALYGSGMSLEELEELVTSDVLPSMFDLNFPFIHSIIDTRRVNFFIEDVSPHKRLEDFPILTALLSYDLTNGVKYVHTTGEISREVQGSYSIPLFFPIVRYDDLFLMDPGILELTPAQTAKVLGADVVISTTAFDELPYNTYDLPIRAWTRFINLIKEENSKEIIDGFSDVTINCAVGDYSFMDYHLAAEFIALGYREAKKLIPEIKQVLAEKKVPVHSRIKTDDYEKTAVEESYVRQTSDPDQVFSDVKAERLVYDFTRIKPLIYFGKEESIFKQDLLREELLTLQYGVFFQKENVEVKMLTREEDFDYLETQFRFIRLTRSLDLIGKSYHKEEDSGRQEGYALDLKYYSPHLTASLGWLETQEKSYIHSGGTYDLNWGETKLRGEVDLYIPKQREDSEVRYVCAQSLNIGVGAHFALQPKFIASNTHGANTRETEIFSHHLIFRGIKPAATWEERLLQASLELDYTYCFPYSIEIFQSIQVKEVNWYQFFDAYYDTEPAYAVGSGVECELSLLGIKPFTFGGYMAYDLETESWRSALSLDLAF